MNDYVIICLKVGNIMTNKTITTTLNINNEQVVCIMLCASLTDFTKFKNRING